MKVSERSSPVEDKKNDRFSYFIRVFRDSYFLSLAPFANIIGAFISIPILISALGLEKYATIGMFLMFVGVLPLLDFGFGNLALRINSDRFSSERKHTVPFNVAILYLISLVSLYAGSTVFVLVCLYFELWELPGIAAMEAVSFSLALFFRHFSWIFRCLLIGFEDFNFLAKVDLSSNLSRHLMPLPLLIFADHGTFIGTYFLVQIAVGLAEITLNLIRIEKRFSFEVCSLTSVVRCFVSNRIFLIQSATSNLLGFLNSFQDKLIVIFLGTASVVGGYQALSIFGTAITMLSQPITKATLPAVIREVAKPQRQSSSTAFAISSSLISKLTLTIYVPCLLCVTVLVDLVLGEQQMLGEENIILIGLLTLSAIQNISGMAYQFQLAKGNLKYHIRYTCVMICVGYAGGVTLFSTYGVAQMLTFLVILRSLGLLGWCPLVLKLSDFRGVSSWYFSTVIVPIGTYGCLGLSMYMFWEGIGFDRNSIYMVPVVALASMCIFGVHLRKMKKEFGEVYEL